MSTYTQAQLWDIINDILDSLLLAQAERDPNIYATVLDYVVNKYGDD